MSSMKQETNVQTTGCRFRIVQDARRTFEYKVQYKGFLGLWWTYRSHMYASLAKESYREMIREKTGDWPKVICCD